MCVSLRVASSVMWALEGNDEVIGVDDRDVLIVAECSVEAIREEVGED